MDKATKFFSSMVKAAATEPMNWFYQQALGQHYLILGHPKKALEYLERAHQLCQKQLSVSRAQKQQNDCLLIQAYLANKQLSKAHTLFNTLAKRYAHQDTIVPWLSVLQAKINALSPDADTLKRAADKEKLNHSFRALKNACDQKQWCDISDTFDMRLTKAPFISILSTSPNYLEALLEHVKAIFNQFVDNKEANAFLKHWCRHTLCGDILSKTSLSRKKQGAFFDALGVIGLKSQQFDFSRECFLRAISLLKSDDSGVTKVLEQLKIATSHVLFRYIQNNPERFLPTNTSNLSDWVNQYQSI